VWGVDCRTFVRSTRSELGPAASGKLDPVLYHPWPSFSLTTHFLLPPCFLDSLDSLSFVLSKMRLTVSRSSFVIPSHLSQPMRSKVGTRSRSLLVIL